MSVIGLDIGTTGCKAIIFNDQWEITGQSRREYPILTPRPHWAEQDAELVWKLAIESLGEAVSKNKAVPPTALALSVQGEAIMPVDTDGVPLRQGWLSLL